MNTYNFPQPAYDDPGPDIREFWTRRRCGRISIRDLGIDPLRWLSDAEDDITADDPDA